MNAPQHSLGQATIYLAEHDVKEPADLVKEDGTIQAIALAGAAGLDGTLFVQQHDATSPTWVEPLSELAGQELGQIRTQLAGAALVVRLSGRFFALTFGQGRHILKPDLLVDDFGLRVAANTVDPTQIRSVDGRTFERGVLLTRRQTSRPDRVEALGMQLDREMFRSITGRARTKGGGRIHGGTSLGLTRDIDLEGLEAFGAELLAEYAGSDYRDAFEQIDQIRPVPRKSSDLVELDQALIHALHQPDARGAYLAPPTLIDWETISAFRFEGDVRGVRRDELVLHEYLDELGHPVATEDLARDVCAIDRDSPRTVARWPIYNCLIWETELNSKAFVLADGRWWSVGHNYLQTVNRAMDRVTLSKIPLPVPSRPGLAEDAYNIEAAAACGGILLDKKLARVRTERGGFELCDIFVPPNQFVHVKRGLGSQELTYLFAQGVQSAEGFRNAREVRARMVELVGKYDKKLAASLPIDTRPDRDAFEVVYAIVSGSPGRVPRTLPFFARAALARSVRTLVELDFSYSAIGIPTQ